MAASAAAKSRASNGAVSKAAWGKLVVHDVVCSSGALVKFRIPNLNALLVSDQIPENLRSAVLMAMSGGIGAALAGGEKPSDTEIIEMLKGDAEFRPYLVAQGLVEPAYSAEELVAAMESGEVPVEDVDMLADIALRQRFTDARGVWLGVRPLSSFESFLHDYECEPGCEACASNRERVSDGRVGAV